MMTIFLSSINWIVYNGQAPELFAMRLNNLFGSPIPIEKGYHIPFFIALGLIASNYASLVIVNVNFIKNDFLWKKAGFHPKKGNLSLQEWWKEKGYNSEISPYLGIVERIILVAAGVVSFQLFFAASGAWATIKIAVDWQQFKEIKFRVISHIYLISSALSILLALIDVATIRVLLGMSFLDI